MQHHFRIGSGLADRPGGDDLLAQRQPVREIAVVGNGNAAIFQFGKERLDIAQCHFARGRIAGVTDGH
jgi:hypothetical protein